MSQPTPNQQRAIDARGNILVVAGAGAGKTRTLVQRCIAFLLNPSDPGTLEEVLMVTFTEAAAAEMRKRIRETLEKLSLERPDDARLHQELALLDSARICTLHSFCLQLVKEQFHRLGLDPQVGVLPEEQSRLLAREILDALLVEVYEGQNSISEPVQRLVSEHGRGWDQPVRELVLRIHAYTQTLPSPQTWFDDQLSGFAQPTPALWEQWLSEELIRWKDWWQQVLKAQEEENVVAQRCLLALALLTPRPTRNDAAGACERILAADQQWPTGKKGRFREPIKRIFEEAGFFHSLCAADSGVDPLQQDWDWARDQITALLQLAQQFGQRFQQAKREMAALDFQDLEQFSLEVLWDRAAGCPTEIARLWQQQFRMVLVDEYQDINAAQDTILRALSRSGKEANRFLVGDVKQSIYRFRLANPRIFLDYETQWNDSKRGEVIPLSDNFRSHEAILNFVNPLFEVLMRPEIGGVHYDEAARLNFGNRDGRRALTIDEEKTKRIELHLHVSGTDENEASEELEGLSNTEKEARLIGMRLMELKNGKEKVWKNGTAQPLEWSDIVILLRSPRNKAEIFAKEFARLGIPLVTSRSGFYATQEVMDILNLLRLLDNPLQDLPLLAVLRSPFVGLTLDELAVIRIARRDTPLWTSMRHWHQANELKNPPEQPALFSKLSMFLPQFDRWRGLMKQISLSQLAETILDETYYLDWLLAQARGQQRRANAERLLESMRQFDSLKGQGLFRFIRFVDALADAEIDLEPAGAFNGNAVRLMSIHQSKGLEFPVVVAADLGKAFNFAEAKEKVILDEVFGICPLITPPGARQGYPSLPFWLAQRRQRVETLGEELRLLYVALTRPIDRLILTGSVRAKAVAETWPKKAGRGIDVQEIADAKTYLDWIGPWLASRGLALSEPGESDDLTWKIYGENDSRLLVSSEATFAAEENVPTATPTELDALRSRLQWQYKFSQAITEPAKTSVSALRRRLEVEEDAQPWSFFRKAPSCASGQLSSAEVGIAHHAFLEFLSLEKLKSKEDLESEAERMVSQKILSPDQAAALDFEAIARFWNSKIGQKIVEQQKYLKREHPFTSRLRAKDFSQLVVGNEADLPADEFVILQGVVDLAVILPEEIWLLDFKTDQIDRGDLSDRMEYYRQQILLYADAMTKIYDRPVKHCWLHFLALQETVEVSL